MSRPLEPGKILYCFPCSLGDFVDLVTWAGLGGCEEASPSLAKLFDAIWNLRQAVTSRSKSKGRQGIIDAATRVVQHILETNGDAHAGYASAGASAPLRTTARVVPKRTIGGALGSPHTEGAQLQRFVEACRWILDTRCTKSTGWSPRVPRSM